MKKTVLALALGAAFAAPGAHADVTISGSINMAFEYLNAGSTSNAAINNGLGNTANSAYGLKTSNFGVSNNYSNITISSVDDLGGGTKLDFAFQLQTANTTAGGTLTNRNSHIGLASESWGGVWVGSNENIYERYMYTIDPLDGAAGLGGNLQIMGTPGGSHFGLDNSANGSWDWYRRDSQVVWYDSPSFGGFTFGAAYGTNYAKNNSTVFAPNNPGAGSTNPQFFQLGAKYVGTSIPLQGWVSYGQRKDQFGLNNFLFYTYGIATDATDSKDQALQLGAAYTIADFTFFGIWEQLKYKQTTVGAGTLADVNAWKRSAWDLGAKWNLATGYIGGQYQHANNANCTVTGGSCILPDGSQLSDNTKAYSFSLGYYHNLSKQTQAFLVGSYLKNGDYGQYQSAGIQNASSTNIGNTQWGLGLGLKHTF